MKKEGLSGKKILIGVTGGIAAYKTAEIVSQLTQHGAEVKVIMTAAAQRFITPLTFQTLSRNPVYTDLWEPAEPYNPRHIALADWAEIVLVAPATANIIGKLAAGMADDLLSTVLLSVTAPVLMAPAMNDKMYKNPIVQGNIIRLKKLGYKFIPPDKGYLACGKEGEGRLAGLETILQSVTQAL